MALNVYGAAFGGLTNKGDSGSGITTSSQRVSETWTVDSSSIATQSISWQFEVPVK